LTRKLLYGLMLAALVAFSALAIACGDDDDDDDGGDNGGNGGDVAERQEVADLALTLGATNPTEATQEEIDFWLAHVADSFVQEFGTESVEVCREDAVACIGEPLPNAAASPDDVSIDGDSADAILTSDVGRFGLAFSKEGEEWIAQDLYVPDDDIGDAEAVDLEMVDFGFNFDADDLTSGDFALHAVNNGEQVHEIILVALPADGEILDILQDETFQPEPLFVKFPYEAGDESDVALPAPLDPGRYGFVCFLPDTDDPEGTPHAFLGMAADFTVE
jgi:hypothetical protein